MKSIHNLSFSLILIFGLNTATSYATDYVSNGAGTAWGTATNWTPNGIPVAGDNVTISAGTTIIMGANRTVNDLYIVATASFTKGNILTIEGNFTNYGTMIGTGTMNFNTNTPKTVTGNGSWATAANSYIMVFNVSTTITSDVSISKRGNIQVNNGSTVTNNGSVILTLSGNLLTTSGAGTWTNNAATSTLQVMGAMPAGITLNASVSGNTVIYRGGTYTIKVPSSSTYHHLTLGGGAGVTKTAAAALTINGTVTVEASTTFATGANVITLVSNAAGTARIGNSAGTITTSGGGYRWIIQRYIGASSPNWNDISTPINGNNISDWDGSVANELYLSIGNTCPDGMAGGWSSVYYWNEATQAWVEVSNCVEALANARGVELWLATSTSSFSATTMDSRGAPNFGNKVASLGVSAGEWSLIGNPYASGISWGLIYADASTTGLTNYFSVFDETINDYAVWDGASPGSSTGQLLGSGGIMAAHQGFWVENSGAAPTLTFKESHKDATNRPLVREAAPSDVLKMRLYSEGRKNACESVIKIQDDASEFFDANTDFSYRKSRDMLTPSLTPVTADNRKVRIKAVPAKTSLSVPVAATLAVAGTYRIDFSGVNRIFKYNSIILEDTETGVFFPLSSDKTYSFTQKDISKERKFILHFSNLRNYNLTPIENLIHAYPVDEGVTIEFNFDELTNTNISICNTLGQEVLTRNVKAEKESITLPLDKDNQLYFVKITTAAGTSIKKIFH